MLDRGLNLFSKDFREQNRKGLSLTPYTMLLQYSSLLKGIFCHMNEQAEDAVSFYTESLVI